MNNTNWRVYIVKEILKWVDPLDKDAELEQNTILEDMSP